MNEKEFNLAILKELRKIAGKVFAKVTVSKEGTYTAAELWDEKDDFGESIVIDYKGTESEIYTAEIGTFKMQVTPQKLWYVLWKFERLCNVRQADKIRFTYGEAEHEIVNEKAMYYTGNYKRAYSGEITGEGNYKVVTRKNTLKKLSENVAKDKKGRVFYKCDGMWYNVSNRNSEIVIDTIKRNPNYIMDSLSKYDFSIKSEWTSIYKALFDALKSERGNNTPEQRKSENDAENTVICEVEKVNTSARDFNKHEAMKETEKRMREKHPNYIALIRYNGMYYSYEKSAKEVRFVDGVLEHITDTGDYICFSESLLDEVLPKLIKTGRGVLTCDMIEKETEMEDYPPEPYNEAESSELVRPRNELIYKYSDHERNICDHTEKSANSWGNGVLMLPGYLRQKVFPAESFQSRRKIIRFKPRCFAGYTNYHLLEGSVVKRKRNGNTSVYRALIRGETEIGNW